MNKLYNLFILASLCSISHGSIASEKPFITESEREDFKLAGILSTFEYGVFHLAATFGAPFFAIQNTLDELELAKQCGKNHSVNSLAIFKKELAEEFFVFNKAVMQTYRIGIPLSFLAYFLLLQFKRR